MSNIHQSIPEDCKKYINGLYCDFRKCRYIHSAAQREDAMNRRKQYRNQQPGKNSTGTTCPKQSNHSRAPKYSPLKEAKGPVKTERRNDRSAFPVIAAQRHGSNSAHQSGQNYTRFAPVKKNKITGPNSGTRTTPRSSTYQALGPQALKKFVKRPEKRPAQSIATVLKYSDVVKTYVPEKKGLKNSSLPPVNKICASQTIKKPGKSPLKQSFTTVLRFCDVMKTYVPVEEGSEIPSKILHESEESKMPEEVKPPDDLNDEVEKRE